MKQHRGKPKPLYRTPVWPTQAVLNLKGVLYRRKMVKRTRVIYADHVYPTAAAKSSMQREFVRGFKNKRLEKRGNQFAVELNIVSSPAIEAETTIAISDYKGIGGQKRTLAFVGIGFDAESVIIEVIQGRKRFAGGADSQLARQRFASIAGRNWPNFLIEQVEANARKMHLSKVRIKRPETLTAYQEADKKIRRQIRLLYYSAANAMGYRKAWPYFEKDLL